MLTFHFRMMVQIITAPPTHPPMTAITVIVVFGTLDLVAAPVVEADSEAEAAAALALVTVLVNVGALEEATSGAAVGATVCEVDEELEEEEELEDEDVAEEDDALEVVDA